MSPKAQAALWRALLGLVLVELPIITAQLQQPVFDYKLLAIGLLGAAAGYFEKLITFDLQAAPVTLAMAEQVIPPTSAVPVTGASTPKV